MPEEISKTLLTNKKQGKIDLVHYTPLVLRRQLSFALSVRNAFIWCLYALIKNKIRFSSHMKKFRGIRCKDICAFPHILGSPSSYMTLHLIPSEFPYIWWNSFFLSLSVCKIREAPIKLKKTVRVSCLGLEQCPVQRLAWKQNSCKYELLPFMYTTQESGSKTPFITIRLCKNILEAAVLE